MKASTWRPLVCITSLVEGKKWGIKVTCLCSKNVVQWKYLAYKSDKL